MTVLLDRPVEVTRRGGGSGWRPALRIARRELVRAPARTLVVLLMVLLPVTAVVALDTLLRTGEVSAAESLPLELRDAQARIEVFAEGGPVAQSPDGRLSQSSALGAPVLDEATLRELLPAGSRLLPVRDALQERGVRTPDGRVARAVLVGADLRDPATRGPWAVLSGRAPATADEVVVSAALADAGFLRGSVLVLADGRERRVTGTVAVPPSYGAYRAVVGLPAAVGLEDAPLRFVWTSGAEVTWADVLEVNGAGGLVLSRSVVLDPPPADEVPQLPDHDQTATTAAILALITVMAVLEVVLLAGPAFAVGARRSRRALALLAATGGEPRHVRRVVLAQGLLIGVGAAVLGAGLGIGLAAAARAPLTRWADARWGPFEVSLRDVVLLCLLGAGTAVLAAVVPAVVAARQPVVASLTGRRPSPVRTTGPTAVGVGLLVVGVLSCLGSLRRPSSELLIAFSALPTVVGAVLLAPALLHGLGRLAGRMPLPLRYAVRDADRQRSRTAPAVAAVAATVAAAFALGTAALSDAREQRETYTPSGPPGAAVVTSWSPEQATDWTAVEAAARRALPGEDVVALQGLALQQTGGDEGFDDVQLCRPGSAGTVPCDGFPASYAGSLGSSVLAGSSALDVLAPLLEPASVVTARRALAEGAVVAFGVPAGTVEVQRQRILPPPDGGQVEPDVVARVTAPVVSVQARDATPPALAVVGDELARRLGGATTVSVVVGDALTRDEEQRLQDEVSLVDAATSTSVERGPRDDERLAVLLLTLGAAVLVLAGTFAATSLALVEAQPDFAVLGQVGARPRTRRLIAGAYAAVLALAGGVLGVLAGAVPGLSAAVALTRTSYAVSGLPGEQLPSTWRYVDVPGLLLLGLLVVLPLLAGALAALSVRSTPPSPPAGLRASRWS